MSENKMVIDERIKRIIAGAVAEIDLEQIKLLKNWSPAERVRQALAMIKAGEQAAAYRLRQRKPHLSEAQALREVRLRAHKNDEKFQTWRKKI